MVRSVCGVRSTLASQAAVVAHLAVRSGPVGGSCRGFPYKPVRHSELGLARRVDTSNTGECEEAAVASNSEISQRSIRLGSSVIIRRSSQSNVLCAFRYLADFAGWVGGRSQSTNS